MGVSYFLPHPNLFYPLVFVAQRPSPCGEGNFGIGKFIYYLGEGEKILFLLYGEGF